MGWTARAQTPSFGWATNVSGPCSNAWLLASTVDKDGNLYFGGSFAADVISIGGVVLTNLSAPTGYSYSVGRDAFVAKYDHSGNPLWVRQIGGDGFDGVSACATDGDGNVFVTGEMSSTNMHFGTNVLTTVGGNDIFLAKYDSAGNLLWVRLAGGESLDEPFGLAVDRNGGARLSGRFFSTNLFFGTNLVANPDGNLAAFKYAEFVAAYSGSGDFLWARKALVGSYAWGGFMSVGVDSNANTYISSIFLGVADFETMTLTNSGGSSVFIAKYDAAGNPVWVREAASLPPMSYVHGVAVSPQGEVHILGESGVHVYVAKYDVSGDFLWVNSILGNGLVDVDVVLDGIGNCYAVGAAMCSLLQFGSVSITNSDPYTGAFHAFAAKYAANGSLLWAKLVQSTGIDSYATGAVDAFDNFYLFGRASAGDAGLPFALDGIVLYGATNYSPYYFAARIDGPSLHIQPQGGQIVLSWPTNAVGLKLETATGSPGGSWSPITNTPAVVGNQFTVTDAVSGSTRLYRLRNY